MMTRRGAFIANEFVWAKVTGYPYWPSVVTIPSEHAPPKPAKDSHWVYFFGTHNYSWVRRKYIKRYDEYKFEYINKKWRSRVEFAYKELKWNRKNMKVNSFFKIEMAELKLKEPRARSVSSRASSRASVRSRGDSESVKSGSSMRTARSVVSEKSIYEKDLKQSLVNRLEDVRITKKTVGVILCSMYGETLTRNLLGYNHKVVIWCPSRTICHEMMSYASTMKSHFTWYQSLRELVYSASIIFSCFSNPAEAKACWQESGLFGSNDYTLERKIVVEMTSVSYHSSYDFENCLIDKGAFYVEAMIQGTLEEGEEEEILRILVGARYETIQVLGEYASCFVALGKDVAIVGDVGLATKGHAVLQLIKAVCLAGFAETVALLDDEIPVKNFTEAFRKSQLHSIYFERILNNMEKDDYYTVEETVAALQQDLCGIMAVSETNGIALPMTSTANQIYKSARLAGYDDFDSSCMVLLGR